MTLDGSRSNLTYKPLTCRYCARWVCRSLYCSWRCAARDLLPLVFLGAVLWAVLIFLSLTLPLGK